MFLQNLNDKGWRGMGNILRHGRAWAGAGWETWSLCVEWCGPSWPSFRFCVSGDKELHLRFWFLWTLYVTVDGRALQRIPDSLAGREASVSVHDGAVWWRLWEPDHSWTSGTPWWRDGCFRPVDVLFGRTTVEDKQFEAREVEIPMPEGPYMAEVSWHKMTVRRSRWPRTWSTWLSCKITPRRPIPEPGKGESAWDCGEDALYKTSLGASERVDYAWAIGQVVETVMRRRGHRKWRPERAPDPSNDECVPEAA